MRKVRELDTALAALPLGIDLLVEKVKQQTAEEEIGNTERAEWKVL